MDVTNDTTNGSFDPFSQTINITVVPEYETMSITLEDFSRWQLYATRACINYGSQFGASITLLILLLTLTKSDRRRSIIFITNCIGLTANAIRNLLQAVYFTTEYWNPYVYFTGDTSRITTSITAQSVTAAILPFIVYTCILASLNLQIRVMLTIATYRWQRIVIQCISLALALVTLTFRFCLCAINAKAIVDNEITSGWQWLPQACNILLTITICTTSLIFCGKLVCAIYQRRTIGLRAFGPLQVLLVMSLQTFLIPSLFALVQFTSDVAQLYSLVQTSALLCLPLSAMWASAKVGERQSSVGLSTPSFVRQWKCSLSSSSISPLSSGYRKESHASQGSPASPRVLEEGCEGRHSFDVMAMGTYGIR
ncbi:hypothetical protein EJ05DRAFT_334010 [Pseudovirgaria hyperparasitica]|uniref:Uncharacterized protein n=1 Tax=Pseudovirgaria hyperparasitica TaxID=470096 RepID=A0A6A6WBC9_9PEZI|nr:uncharacterized protein EJ05DRAFT_334010 [Pseudovirgaria hyperparasitica]KAF2759146.1 hypothetical protein EJ05DRAFT_334010 [Pseudovirgaria hyperparasitica]